MKKSEHWESHSSPASLFRAIMRELTISMFLDGVARILDSGNEGILFSQVKDGDLLQWVSTMIFL